MLNLDCRGVGFNRTVAIEMLESSGYNSGASFLAVENAGSGFD